MCLNLDIDANLSPVTKLSLRYRSHPKNVAHCAHRSH